MKKMFYNLEARLSHDEADIIPVDVCFEYRELTEALPAVTVPPFLNTDGSLDRISIVVLGLGCSST